ncbi:unnamed protein product [Closterium sp. NIES-65]|nr:unnamed protein product [Closterium sp. NIES-65]
MDGIVDSWKLPSPVASLSTSHPPFQLIDCHAHTYPSQFPHTDFLPLLRRAAAACVSHIVTVPETLADAHERQLSLAAELGLPVNVHSRSAGHHAIEEIVQSGLPATSAALMHAFDGRLVHAERAERHGGFFFSVPPSVVRSPQTQKLVKGLPLSCLVLETDSPALAPEKGATNEPCNIVVSCREIARIHGVTVAEVAKTTSSHSPMAAVTLSQTATASCRATFSSVKLESKLKRSVSLAVQPAFAWKSAGVASTASFKGVGSVVVRAVAEDVQGGGNYGAPREIPGTKIYVGNLPFNVDSESLAEIFQEAGVVELVEVIYDRDSGRSRGFGFVTMSTPEEAQSAIEKFDGSELGGRMLKVNMPVPRGERERGARNERPRGDRPRFGGNQGNKLYVGNLSWGMDDMALEDLFAEFGKVLEAKVVLDRDSGRSRGFGFVTLSSDAEVQEAISNLDGADVDGRQLRVNVAAPKV